MATISYLEEFEINKDIETSELEAVELDEFIVKNSTKKKRTNNKKVRILNIVKSKLGASEDTPIKRLKAWRKFIKLTKSRKSLKPDLSINPKNELIVFKNVGFKDREPTIISIS